MSLGNMLMIRWLIIIFSLFFTPLISYSSENIDILKKRLNKINSFQGQFVQKINNSKNNEIQQGKGYIWIVRPNKFNWHMQFPDENLVISDGKTLWFYNAYTNQATAMWLKQAIENTPFMFIICNDISYWRHYSIKRKEDHFFLTPKFKNENLNHFIIQITDNGMIKSFITIEKSGQQNIFKISHQKNGPIHSSKFKFFLPKNAILDDQR